MFVVTHPSADSESKARNAFLAALRNKIEFLNKNPNRDILFADLVTQTTRVLTEGRRPLRRQLAKTMQDSFPKELDLATRLADQIKSVNNWTPQEVKIMAENCLEAIGIPKFGIYSYIELNSELKLP